ncbi:MAG: translation initiation factor IF-2 [Thermoanaerobaculia bacterium]
MSAKFTVSELAKMMGKPPKEVLFLLQGIGVDVKSVESVLDPTTAQAILTGKTTAPKSLIVRQTSSNPPSPGIAAVTEKRKTERAALKRIKIVDKPLESETSAVAEAPEGESAASAAAHTSEGVSASPAVERETAVVAEKSAAAAQTAAPAAAEASAPAAQAAPAHTAPAPAAAEAPKPSVGKAVVAPPPSAPAAPRPARPAEGTHAPASGASAHTPHAPAPAHAPSHAPHSPTPHAGPAGASAAPPRRAVPAPHTPAGAPRPGMPARPFPPRIATPVKPVGPAGALGRILKRTGEPSLPRPLGPPIQSPQPSMNESSGASAGPHSPGVTHVRTPAPPPPGSPAVPAHAAPIRGAGGLGRAVIAAPSPASMRPFRPATPAPVNNPIRPSGPGQFQRPGFPPRPTGPGGFTPRPGFGRGPAQPAMPPGPPLPVDKRRKDAAKPGVATKRDDAKKAASKKPRTKEVSALEEDMRDYLGTYKPDTYEDVTAVEIGEDGLPIMKILSKSAQRRAGKKTMSNDAGNVVEMKKAPSGPVFLSEGVTVKELSDKIGIMAKDLMKSFFSRGVFATINQPLDPKMAIEIAKEFGIDAAIVSFEEELELSRQQALNEVKDAAAAAPVEKDAAGMDVVVDGKAAPVRVVRAPVVTVMGHVDHGKTSLLDSIRKAKVAEGEAGGITQHMGAYRVQANGKPIVFLDTPGHEAFTMMRSRGAKATDIVVLVVAADDGVMPQTSEAIDHARAAKVPIVVAINKIDKPDANVGRVKQELAEKGVLVEEFGGEVVACEISAKKNIGIDHLLEMILLQAELLELKAVTEGPAKGVVLEARREVGKGTLATVLVQQGTLRVSDVFFAGAAVGRVRAMLDDHGNRVESAGPATPVEVMGFDDLPNSGDTLQVVEDEQKARQVSAFRSQKERDESLVKSSRMSLDSLFSRMNHGEAKDLALIVKADVHGSEEVLVQSLNKLSTEKVKVSVLHSGVGAISVNDVLLASASEAIIIGFNVRPEKKAQELAEHEGVDIRLYTVIYTLTDEIKKAMTGLLDTVKKEVSRGHAEVRDTFKVPKIGTIGGCMVLDGVIPRGASVRLLRDNRVIYEGKIGSLRRFKDDASEVKSGFECGIGIAGYQDLKIGDVIEAYVFEEVAPSLT